MAYLVTTIVMILLFTSYVAHQEDRVRRYKQLIKSKNAEIKNLQRKKDGSFI